MTDTTYTFNGMTVNHNGIRVLPDPQPPETAERVSQVILTSGIDIGAEAEKEMSRDTANDQGSEKVVGGGSASAPTSAQSVNEVHAPSGAEWYDREWRAIKEANPEWTDNQVTNKMSEIVWDNNYHALIDEIAHSSSPGERERLIREHQVELDKYRASGIKVDNDITALRNVQGMPSIMMGLNLGEYGQSEQYQKDQAVFNEWQRRVDSGERLNIDFDQAYQNEANAAAVRLNLYNGFQVCQKYGFFDNLISQLHADHMRWGYTATLTKQDQANGYRLDYFSDVDAYLRVRSADNIHPDDLIKYYEHLRGAESATNSVLAGIGKASADITNGAIAGTLGLGKPDGSGWTQFGYHLTKDAPKIDLAVSTLWGGYGLSKILRFGGQRVLSSESLGDKIGSEGLGNAAKETGVVAKEASNSYRTTFFTQHPELKGKVVVHHGVEQQVLKNPNTTDLFTKEEINAYNNLRGIPKVINSELHLSKIRIEWNEFYRDNPFPLKKDLLMKRLEIDMKYGNLFNPPIE